MVTRVHSFLLRGIDALPCEIEVDISPIGKPATTIVGLPDAAVKESAERVRTAMLNSGFLWSQKRLTVNLAPADLRKEGPVYDLPMAVACLLADGAIPPLSGRPDTRSASRPQVGLCEDARAVAARVGRFQALCDQPLSEDAPRSGMGEQSGPPAAPPDPDQWVFAGELALDGRLRPVRGAISLALMARKMGRRGVVVPASNAPEAAVVADIEVRGARTLGEVVEFLNGRRDLPAQAPVDVDALIGHASAEIDFADVRGQEAAKRAMTIAAAGGHNILLIGPAGTGKTMMARALPGILPPLSRDEALEVTRIYSSIGGLPRGEPVIVRRPVRTPHHTASTPAIVGGGSTPRPGEVSLAHRGVLFLDELPEFSRVALEALREPLEDGHVTIARAHGAVRFPARVMLVAAMNPTQQGGGRVEDVARDPGERYLSRLSGPLVDRIDIHVEVPAVPFRALSGARAGTDSATMRARVLAAREVQRRRNGPTRPGGAGRTSGGDPAEPVPTNAELSGRQLDRVATLGEHGRDLMARAMTELGLSARAYDKVRRVARTIADLAGSPEILDEHVAEAVQYRLLDRKR